MSAIIAKTASDWSDEVLVVVEAASDSCLNSTKPPDRAFLFVSLIQTKSLWSILVTKLLVQIEHHYRLPLIVVTFQPFTGVTVFCNGSFWHPARKILTFIEAFITVFPHFGNKCLPGQNWGGESTFDADNGLLWELILYVTSSIAIGTETVQDRHWETSHGCKVGIKVKWVRIAAEFSLENSSLSDTYFRRYKAA